MTGDQRFRRATPRAASPERRSASESRKARFAEFVLAHARSAIQQEPWCESLVSLFRVVQPGTLRNGPPHARPYRTQPVSGLHHFVGHEITVVLDVRPKPPIRRL